MDDDRDFDEEFEDVGGGGGDDDAMGMANDILGEGEEATRGAEEGQGDIGGGAETFALLGSGAQSK